MRRPDGQLNGVRVHRLKNKYGTKGLPTAELELNGMKAQMVKINIILPSTIYPTTSLLFFFFF
jgi:hypothetical protein